MFLSFSYLPTKEFDPFLDIAVAAGNYALAGTINYPK